MHDPMILTDPQQRILFSGEILSEDLLKALVASDSSIQRIGENIFQSEPDVLLENDLIEFYPMCRVLR
jgi:hypothetical protein